ncbi:hypothetical protein OB955_05555 [Halobacteria archaeon AArc-m2/3/4]|uniref:DUF8106 domain-containing protein n=1 Tax=Natronoglomus mannanivorans TaxID=2979990 RepID=A0AAP2Z1M1_9EURY|nr:hypothetical protein [Halobacteria archaeon AArc-xg1-1]MCU4972199.1 hypothetical protein [Halobacteria archaeon AArc-m2/3/4]
MTLQRHRDDERSVRPKSTLFCTACDHESPVGGDWRVRTRGDRMVTVCPDCETAIDDRPVAHDESMVPNHPGALTVVASTRLLLTSTTLWWTPLAVTSSALLTVLDRP